MQDYTMKKTMIPLKAGVLLLLLQALLVLSCSNPDTETGAAALEDYSFANGEVQHPVKVLLIESADFNHELISNGTISAAYKADLRFESSEVIEDIFVRNGQRVSKGQKIATLSQFKLRNTLAQAMDNLEKSSLELQDVLIGQGYALRDSLQVPEEVMKIAKVRSNYENSVIQYELARHHLDRSVLYAPFDGIVANLFSKKYNIPPGTDPFCTIIGNQALDADFMVMESELAMISVGNPVQIAPFAFTDYTVDGKITEINPMVDVNGMVKVKAQILSHGARLYDGMNVRIRIQRSLGHQLFIPKEALVLRSNRKVVFTIKGGKAVWNYVQTGVENSTGYLVSEGLRAGDSIIYEGNRNLAHDTPIRIIN